MAKLSSRGRTCLAEAVREYSAEQLQAQHDRFYPDKAGELPLTKWERTIKRLMSDGKVLEKRTVQFKPDWLDKQGRRHDYGWKVAATLKPGKTVADFIAVYSGPTKSGKPSQWTVTTNVRERTPVISQRRIIAAIESGDYVGFCTDCGSDQSGVEPDASGYTCQSCGKPSVQGAENLLGV